MCHRYAAIDTKTFHLEEHRIVSGIGSITPKHTARRNHPDRHATTLHRVNLDSRGLGAKRETVSGVERVLRRAGRMVGRNIERIEVVEVSLYLAVVFDGVPQCHKDVFQSFAQESDRMAMSGAWAPARQCDVDTFAGRALVLDIV